ncbi:MAG: deoxyguanosinetriphosphate triphosphohydrolase [Clostridia bacterium]|nr:deoxyguanosinetriphosphate triphosphohydrolase [Clostridia bacterium]
MKEKIPELKERTYAIEDEFFSPYAKKSKDTAGRQREEEPCGMRTDFQRDRDRIIYCKAFRRLKNKTQVFFSPEGDHYITRLTHTFDVAQIARSIARALSLNEDLAEAIALGHDLGHTPFGHSGERILNKLSPAGFRHNEQSLRVVDVLEKRGKGLNLTYEVRDGILNHNKFKEQGVPSTLEGKCVCFADRIAYINHDLDDAIRAGVLKQDDVPVDIVKVLGSSSKERINTAITSIYLNSRGKNLVAMGEEVKQASEALRSFMFERVYYTPFAQGEEGKAERMLGYLYELFVKDPSLLPPTYLNFCKTFPVEQVVCDYLSSMTDRYAIYTFNRYFVPKGWTFGDELS